MNNSSSQNEVIFISCLGAVALLGLGISNFFGVPFLEGIKIIPGVAVWALVFGALTYYGFLKQVSPIAVATLWLSFMPILDYKAGVYKDTPPFHPEIKWYGTTLGQASVFIAILIIGYALLYWWNNRD